MQKSNASELLAERFRCPGSIADFEVTADLFSDSGFARSVFDAVRKGQLSFGASSTCVTDLLRQAGQQVQISGSRVQLPFDPVQVVDNLRLERYAVGGGRVVKSLAAKSTVRDIYYLVRPFMPVAVRKQFQKRYFHGWDKIPFPTWPVDRTVENIFEQLLVLAMKSGKCNRIPFIWFWPDGARSCTIMTHDVETSRGLDFCSKLMDLNDSFGIKSSFQLVPEERYTVTSGLLENIRQRGFEVNVHDLNHDGQLFSNRTEFLRRAERIKHHAHKFEAQGFRSAILYRNTDWYDALDFSYDMSIPNVAHLDPQRGGCCTVFPFFIGRLLELPVTATQDYSLFQILNEYSIRLWKKQIALIREKHGLISFIIHPDYIIAKTAQRIYVELLQYLAALRSQGETWIALPGEVAAWWRMRSALNLVSDGSSWQIVGNGRDRARIAYAVLLDNKLVFEIA
jgi:hypothetical protein